ncbi:MAG TPA: hypothetical protein VH599_22580 [Ktedonobacterales bacterium]
MSDAENQAQLETRSAGTSSLSSQNDHAGRRIAWLLGWALVLGLMGAWLVGFETQVTRFAYPITCGLGNPPCSSSSTSLSVTSGPEMIHPCTVVGLLVIACGVICLLRCLMIWYRDHKDKVEML